MHGLPCPFPAGSSSRGTRDQTRCMKPSPPFSLQPSPLHSKSTGSSGASRAVGQEGRQAQELWFISGSTSFDDIRFIQQKYQTTRQDMLWDKHPGHTCVTEDRSYSRHMLLCVALQRRILCGLCKSYPRFLFASECNLATAIRLQTSHLNVFPPEDILSLYSYSKQFKSAE